MLNVQAQNSLQFILESSLRSMLNENYLSAEWELTDDIEKLTSKEFCMLTISATTSRYIAILHFSTCDSVRKIVADRLKLKPSEMEESQFYDCIAEMGNIFAGSVKRGLSLSITYTGLSVPSLMKYDSFEYINQIASNINIHTVAKCNEMEFAASLFVLADDDISILSPDLVSLPDEADCGELEMF